MGMLIKCLNKGIVWIASFWEFRSFDLGIAKKFRHNFIL
jgi:hypothetical protein